MSKLIEEMAQGTAEGRAYMEGERKGYKATPPETVEVRGPEEASAPEPVA